MNALRQYDINIAGLQPKRYEYDFESDDALFAALEQTIIAHGTVQTHLILDKSETMIRLDFHIVGSVEQICDRILDEYEQPVDTRRTMLLKFGDHNEELSDEIELIERNTQIVNVGRFIFEFLSLSLPMKRLHPRFRDEEDEEEDQDSPGRLVYQSDTNQTTDGDKDTPTETIDPRWAALRKLSDN